MMAKDRQPSSDERELFEETLKDAKPFGARKRTLKSTPPAKPSEPKAAATKTAQRVTVSPAKTGIDGNTADRLSRGQLEPEARLDLHGMTEAVAHTALVTFLRAASARKLRLILVVTGKGRKPPSFDEPFDLELDVRSRGVLRILTPRWLAEPELVRFVADVRAAHRRHGGDGALYVYLRKPK